MSDITTKALSVQEWEEIQIIEAATWTRKGWIDPETGKEYKAFPSFEGKLERERGYQRKMLDLFRISGLSGNVLDVGCGATPILDQVAGNFIGIALDPNWGNYLTEHPFPHKCAICAHPAEEMPFPDNSFHHIISTNALDHFRDPRAALLEMLRVLRVGGTLWLSFCINNATQGHPHPAHRIDLTIEDVAKWSNGLVETERAETIHYGWRNQDAALVVARKIFRPKMMPVV